MFRTRVVLLALGLLLFAIPAQAGIDDLKIVEVESLSFGGLKIEILHNSSSSATISSDVHHWVRGQTTVGNAVIASGATLSANQRIVLNSFNAFTTTDIFLFKNISNFSDFSTNSNIIDCVQIGGANQGRISQGVTAGFWSDASSFTPVVPPFTDFQSIRWDGKGNSGDDWVRDGTATLGSADTDSSGTTSSLRFSASTQNFEGLTVGDKISGISGWSLRTGPSPGDFTVDSNAITPSTTGSRPSSTTKWIRINDTYSGATSDNTFYSVPIDSGVVTPTVYHWDFYVLIEAAPNASAANYPRFLVQHDSAGMSDAWGIEVRNSEFRLLRTGLGGSETTTSIGSYSIDTWYKLTFAVDFTNNQIQGRIDDGNAVTLSTTFNAGADKKRFRFGYSGAGTGNTARILLDDLSFSLDYPADPRITSTARTSAQQGTLYVYSIGTTGSPAPTISVAGLPAWLTRSSNILSGTPSAGDVGTTPPITITADNGSPNPDTQTFQITVTAVQAPSITGTPATVATEGFAYSYTMAIAGMPTPTLTVTGLPSWLSFDNVDTISGTPGAGDVGNTSNITITAANGVNPEAVQSYTLNVLAQSAPVISGAPDPVALVGHAYSYQFTLSGQPEPTLSLTGLPAWLNFDSANKRLSGTPASSDVGSNGPITIEATNGVSPDATQSFSIDVQVPVAPAITSNPDLTATEATAYSYQVAVNGNPDPTISVVGLPGWLSFDSSTAIISGTPGPNDGGLSGNIVVRAMNGISPAATQSFRIDVTVFAAPTITSTAPTSSAVGVPYTYTVSADGFPTPGITVANLPGWLSFDGTDTISGTPQASDAGLTPTIDVTAANGQGSDAIQHFEIFVDNPLPPSITSAAVTAGTTLIPYSYTITADGNPAPIISVSGLPSWLSFDGTDTLSGSPAAGDAGLSGTITVTAANGLSPDATQSFEIDVSLEIPPAITSNPADSVDEGAIYQYVVVASGEPAPTITVANLPAWLSFDGNDTLSGTPGDADVGTTNTITVIASNGIGNDAEQDFTITVFDREEPTITSTPILDAEVGQLYGYTLTGTGTPAPTFLVTGLPSWLSFNGTDVLVGTPTLSDIGESGTITVAASNGFGGGATQQFTITVNGQPPTDGGGSGGVGCTIQVKQCGGFWAIALALLAMLVCYRGRRESREPS